MKRWRFGHGQTPTANGLRRKRSGRSALTARQSEKCARCNLLRWDHERNGLVPDHEFEEIFILEGCSKEQSRQLNQALSELPRGPGGDKQNETTH